MDQFVENLKIFWNQPVPIIGFTVGMVIIGILFIVGRTSIGKKALNKIKSINEELKIKNDNLQRELKENKERCDKFVFDTNEYMKEMRLGYEKIISEQDIMLKDTIKKYEDKLQPVDSLLKSICENSVNIHIKEAFEKYEETKNN